MSDYGGRLIRDTEPTVTSTTASGIWTLEEALKYKQAGTWPTKAVSDPNFKETVLLLHGDGTNGAQNNTFLDSSTNNFTITRNGNTTQGTFSPFSVGAGEWSNYFDGTGDFLESSDNAAFELGSGDFTIESWFYTTNLTNANTIFAKWAASNQSYIFQILSSGTAIRFAYSTDGVGSTIRDYSATINTNEWYHVAVCRASGDTKVFLNGTQIGSTTSDNVTFYNGTSSVSIGKNQASGTTLFFGYLSNVRLVKSAVYTSNFTVPTAPLTAISNTSLLTCQSNRFVDNSTNAFAITRNGDVKVTPFSPFAPSAAYDASTNGGSGYFDGTGDYLSVGAASDWTFMSNTTALFSIELWFYYSAGGSQYTFFGTNNGSSASIGFGVYKLNDEKMYLEITNGSSGNRVVDFASSGTVRPGAWNHVLLTYDQSLASGNVKFYINGASAETGNKTANTPSNSAPATVLRIGTANTTSNFLTGYIGSARISNVVRSSGVPTTPFTSDGDTKLLLNFTNAGIIDNTGKNNLETVGNAQIDTAVKKFGTGSLEFDGTGDWLLMPNNKLLSFDSGDFTVECWFYANSLSAILYAALMGFHDGVNTSAWAAYVRSNGVFIYGSAGTLTGGGTVNTATWYHFAATRSGNTVRVFLNGTQQASATVSGTYVDGGFPFVVGEDNTSLANPPFNGYIDDLRITKGVARYTANFTPPTAPFQDQ